MRNGVIFFIQLLKKVYPMKEFISMLEINFVYGMLMEMQY